MDNADPHVTVPISPATQGGMQENVLTWLAYVLQY